ncbi:unnamed protein product [Nezara viridula]|uniref:CRAL-TRIO domain-containing protein n=1 Tax=Nezara viridula TaxID=85310 RepID=A0A9P0H2P1_NEZVI|nr:unnamed protein product [Nezara viridula]
MIIVHILHNLNEVFFFCFVFLRILNIILRETEVMKKEGNQEDVERLREWLLKQPHHPKVIEDRMLSAFVYGSKSLEIAKQKLESFFTWRAHLRDNYPFFYIRDPSDPYFKNSLKSGNMFFLPKTTPEGYRVFYTGITDQFEEHYDHDQTTACFHMSLELSMDQWPDMKGIFIIWDLKGFKPSYAARLNLSTFETTIRYLQDVYPVKMKGVVFLNTPAIVETFYNTIFKPFLKEKLKKRITITREDSKCLKKYLPEEILPSDLGGKEKSSAEFNEDWLNLLIEKKDGIKSYSLLVADESKRPPETKQTFGIEGTFRTLAID